MKPFSPEVSMKRLVRAFLLFTSLAVVAVTIQAQTSDAQRWQQRARNVTITRDDWASPTCMAKLTPMRSSE